MTSLIDTDGSHGGRSMMSLIVILVLTVVMKDDPGRIFRPEAVLLLSVCVSHAPSPVHHQVLQIVHGEFRPRDWRVTVRGSDGCWCWISVA